MLQVSYKNIISCICMTIQIIILKIYMLVLKLDILIFYLTYYAIDHLHTKYIDQG